MLSCNKDSVRAAGIVLIKVSEFDGGLSKAAALDTLWA